MVALKAVSLDRVVGSNSDGFDVIDRGTKPLTLPQRNRFTRRLMRIHDNSFYRIIS